ncbi:MAG TPA: hypothetical protein VD997_04640 [Phycisphaerales bacterium]|nr:hypothetical protein [Phycisphaerales bacterium]
MASERAAVEYEFYIPAAVWEHGATRAFLAWLTSEVEGATVFKGAVGAWEGQVERTHVVRVLAGADEATSGLIAARAGELMRAWGESPQTRQETLMFTKRTAVVVTVEFGG